MAESQPPGPDGLPFIGNVWRVLNDRLDFIEELSEEYGDVVYRNIMRRDSYMLTHPDDIEEVLKIDDDKYGKMGFKADQTQRVCGTLVDTDELSFSERRMNFDPAFHPDKIAEYSEVMTEFTERTIDDWDDGEVFDLETEIRTLLQRISLKVFYDYDASSEEGREMSKSFQRMLPRMDPKRRSIPEWIPTPVNRQYRRELDKVHDFLEELADQRRRSDEDRDDLLGMLVEAADSGEMSEEFLREELFTMMVASQETTSFTLMMVIYLLSEHPDAWENLQAEVDEVLGDEPPTMDDLSELTYTGGVVREALRLYPPAYAVPRVPEEEVQIREYRIPDGSYIFMPGWAVHRDERWYDDPEEFRPERWTSEFKQDLHEFAFIPFGGGPRGCPGELFAKVELQLVLAIVAQNVVLEPVPDERPELVSGITLRLKDDYEVQVQGR